LERRGGIYLLYGFGFNGFWPRSLQGFAHSTDESLHQGRRLLIVASLREFCHGFHTLIRRDARRVSQDLRVGDSDDGFKENLWCDALNATSFYQGFHLLGDQLLAGLVDFLSASGT
jgi:hypothetical protein